MRSLQRQRLRLVPHGVSQRLVPHGKSQGRGHVRHRSAVDVISEALRTKTEVIALPKALEAFRRGHECGQGGSNGSAGQCGRHCIEFELCRARNGGSRDRRQNGRRCGRRRVAMSSPIEARAGHHPRPHVPHRLGGQADKLEGVAKALARTPRPRPAVLDVDQAVGVFSRHD